MDTNFGSRWVTLVSIILLIGNVLSLSIALLASGWSYTLWSAGGMAFALLLAASPAIGLLLIGIEKWQDRRRDVMWPGLLVLLTGLPLLGLIAAATWLDLP